MSIEDYSPSQFYKEFQLGLEYLNRQDGDELHRSLYYSNMVSLMEKYLLDIFIHEISTDRDKIIKLATHPKFKSQSIKIPYALNHSVEEHIINAMKNIVWHRLNDIDVFYKIVLDIRFNLDTKLLECLKIRHHIVHRNCHDTDGCKVTITRDILQQCIRNIDSFIVDIDKKIYQKIS